MSPKSSTRQILTEAARCRLKLGAWDSVCVFSMESRDQLFQPLLTSGMVYFSRKLELETEPALEPHTVIWNVGPPNSILSSEPDV